LNSSKTNGEEQLEFTVELVPLKLYQQAEIAESSVRVIFREVMLVD